MTAPKTPFSLADQRRMRNSDPLASPLPGLALTAEMSDQRVHRIHAVRETAAAQQGVLTQRQLRNAGWRRQHVQHELDVGRWVRLAPDVLLLQNGPATYDQLLWIGVLHAGTGAVLSHRTACGESGLEGWDGTVIEVLTEKSRNVPPLEGFFFHETRRTYADWIHPTASPARLRLEPAALLAAERQRLAKYAVGLVAATVQQRLTTAERLFVASTGISKLRNGKVIRAALGDIAGGAHSFSELEVGRLCKRAGLMPPTRQRIRVDKRGRRRYLDCEWELADGRIVVLEIDGAFHLEPTQWWRDLARERAVVITGRLVLRCASIELRLEPEEIMTDLRNIGVPTVLSRAA
jgi:hypothetical protein